MKNLKVNVVFQHLEQSNKRITIEEGGTRCFKGETLVLTDKGHKYIKDILEGDKVYSLNTRTNEVQIKRVRKLYKYEHTEQKLIKFIRKGNDIISNYGHEFYYKGKWIRNFEFAERVLERNRRHKEKILYKQFRENKNNELEMHKKCENNETCERCKRILQDDDSPKWKIPNSKSSSFSSRIIHTKYSKETPSESYRPQQREQQHKKLRMGDSQGECSPYDESRETNLQQWRKEWYGKINGETSKRDKKEVQTLFNNKERFVKRVWSFSGDNKGCLIQALEAREIRLDEIIGVDVWKENISVYDLEVEDNHNYLITSDNIVVHNSGKTYNIVHWLIKEARTKPNQVITITRKSFPSLRNSVMRDFTHIMENDLEIFEDKQFNRSENRYLFENGSVIEFISMDLSSKKKGAKRDYLYMNEADEFSLEDFRQLTLRTRHKIILDYNPANEYHWIYDNVEIREDCELFTTTYLDNPFLEQSIIDEIKHLKDVDLNYWRIYGLGLRGVSETSIYTNWEYGEEIEGDITYGLDFGYNDPCALVKAVYKDGQIYFRELLYKSYLTGEMLRDKMKELIKDNYPIYADSSRPELIQELYNAGFNVKPTMKGKGSVKQGIDFLKRHKLILDKESINLHKEVRGYKWQVDKNDNVLDIPVDINDHLCDAIRYSQNQRMKPKSSLVIGKGNIF